MLATKAKAGKAVAVELSVDLNRAEPGLPDDVGYRRSGNLRTIISESLDGRTIRDTAAHAGLLRCNNQWSAKNTFAVRWRFRSAENEQVRGGWFNESVANRHLERVPMRSNHLSSVMPALVAGIHVFLTAPQQARRRWPGQARP
jgi:hypothetical protein